MGLEDPVDAALALCGVDALCYDVSETLSGWVFVWQCPSGFNHPAGHSFCLLCGAPLYSDGSTRYHLFAVPMGTAFGGPV